MPELPDVTVYIEALQERVLGRRLERVKLLNPFILRTAVPPISQAEGKRLNEIRRVGKRIVLELEGPLYLVLHLMIAGRLRWLQGKEKPPGRITLALLEFENGTLAFTEAGTKRRASLHLLSTLEGLDPGGAEVFAIDESEFAARLRRENHTLKRALTDPRLIAGVGNAYSDRRRGTALVRSDTHDARRLDRALARRGGGRLSGEGDGVPGRHGGARALRQALPGVRRAGAAHRVRGERNELLPALSDGRQNTR